MNLLLFLFLSTVYMTPLSVAQTCTQDYAFSASPDCDTLEKPYCIRQGSELDQYTYECGECLSDCDCKIGEFCSGDVWDKSAGKCIKFKAEGKDCIRMYKHQLENKDIPDDYKCADIIRKGGDIVLVDGPGVGASGNGDISATCTNGKCRACDASAGDPYSRRVYCAAGMKEPRTCVSPGKYSSLSGPLWHQAEYHKNPTWVWLAIYFPFVIIGLLVLCCILFRKRLPIVNSEGPLAKGGNKYRTIDEEGK